VHDAGGRRHDAEVVERLLAPLEELVALAVALELDLGVDRSASGEPNSSTCTEWSMTRSTGTSGLIFFGSPPMRGSWRCAAPPGRPRGHAGEVLQHDARRLETF
jgi:hypothetical protein